MQEELKILEEWRASPIIFIQDVWGLKPLKEGEVFEKGKHITNQQFLILRALEKATQGKAPKRISIASGHGIGKSTTMAWLLLWFLFCFKDSQVACTAPTSDQLYDVLWKEIAKWLEKMDAPLKGMFDYSTDHIRIKENPNVWFARAKTAKKEAPEALAGIHAENVLYLADEASGIAEEVYRTAEGAMTGGKAYFIMISNPTRLNGYFYDSHHEDKENWQVFEFSSLDSPIVDEEYNRRIADKFGITSDEYRVRVLGKFPNVDTALDGWTPLFSKGEIDLAQDEDIIMSGNLIFGVDVADGKDKDSSVIVQRSISAAEILFESPGIDTMQFAGRVVHEMDIRKISPMNVAVDSIGVGAGATARIREHRSGVQGVNVAETPQNPKLFVNKRAEIAWKTREWIRGGGKLKKDKRWEELLSIYYKTEDSSGKIRIMSKDEMRRKGIQSPNIFDALALSFSISPSGSGLTHEETEFRKMIKRKHKMEKGYKPLFVK